MQRTFAMRLYAAGYAVLTLSFGYIFLFALLPDASNPDVAAFVPILAVFLGLFVGCAALAAFLPSAPRRRWFWIVGLVPALGFLAMNAPYLPYAATHPSDAAFPGTAPLILWSIVLVIAGVAAFREAGEAGEARAAPGAGADDGGAASPRRSRWLIAALAGATLGISATGYLAASQGGGGASIIDAPTSTDTLVAEGSQFLTASYVVPASGVLGLFVENQDGYAHSFDIDALDIHVAMPAGATVAVSIRPGTAGALEFYCAIPGHREAGMAGTIVAQ